jgi:hypothetical protein
MTTTPTTAADFATQLRTLADLYEAEPNLPTPAYRLTLGAEHGGAVEKYLAVRRLFPNATVDASDSHFVYVRVDGLGIEVAFQFWKDAIAEQRTVTREVVEYVLPEPAVA